MKVALCFYGLIGSRMGKDGLGENLDPTIAYRYYKEHVIDTNEEVDVFIHSWSFEEKDRLTDLYRPKGWLIEKQASFPQSSNHPNKVSTSLAKLKLFIWRITNKERFDLELSRIDTYAFRAYSRWYSSQKSLQLKRDYEIANGLRYDAVMITRLDVGFFRDVRFTDFDLSFFYASHRNDAATKDHDYQANHKNHKQGKEFLDLWFFSNSDNMDKFSLLFDNIEKYNISPHRSSQQHVNKFISSKNVRYTMYRWFDHEMIRRKFFEAAE